MRRRIHGYDHLSKRSKPPSRKQRGKHGKAPAVGYSDALASKVCDRLADGEALSAICRDPGMPDERSVRRWAQDTDHPFAERYSAAREIGYLKLADELLALSDDQSIEVNSRRLMVDTRKFLLMKCLPKIFGERIVNNSVSVNSFHLHTEPMATTDKWLQSQLKLIASSAEEPVTS